MVMRRKTKKQIYKKSINTSVYQIFSELSKKLGDKYSSEFLYDRAEQIIKLYSKSKKIKNEYGTPNDHSRNYLCKNVCDLIENEPWLTVYNENHINYECPYSQKQLLRELGI